MGDVKIYRQCMLKRNNSHQTAWIEKRGAKVGATVELLPGKELWEVMRVFDREMPEDMLKENERLARSYKKRTDI